MTEFKQTTLWRSAFEGYLDDPYRDARSGLRASYLEVREKAAQLTRTIATYLPHYTLHDIQHLDALWETASTICGPEYKINPAEAFVLGCGFLFHDAGMTLAAYPDGLPQIAKTQEWKDELADCYRRANLKPKELDCDCAKKNDYRLLNRYEKDALEATLRRLHADVAARLPLERFGDGQEYVIDSERLRRLYGKVIGAIARSHWSNYSELAGGKRMDTLGPGADMPDDWIVQPIKLACILRCADFANMDERRAPPFLLALLRLSGLSEAHWSFQARLAKPVRKGSDTLLYSSGESFPRNQRNAWWLCFDTLAELDREIHASNELLACQGLPPFKVTRVEGAGRTDVLARYIAPEGWEPIDTRFVVSDVPALVRRLGGKELYGDEPYVAIRELIQNSGDAIRVRRGMRSDSDPGLIRIECYTDSLGTILAVSDDGIGMSRSVLSTTLLDFGASLWSSEHVKKELPGFVAKNIPTTGKYGIGFFSIFMLGDEVSVITRRAEAGEEETWILEFEGVGSRPSLRRASADEVRKQPGTTVKVRLKRYPFAAQGRQAQLAQKWDRNGVDIKDERDPRRIYEKLARNFDSLVDALRMLAPALDADLQFAVGRRAEYVVRANDWQTLPLDAFLARVAGKRGARLIAKNARAMSYLERALQLLHDGHEVLGRGCLWSSGCVTGETRGFGSDVEILLSDTNIVSIGGLYGGRIVPTRLGHRWISTAVLGVFKGTAAHASRNRGELECSPGAYRQWEKAQQQYLEESAQGDNGLVAAALLIDHELVPESVPCFQQGNRLFTLDAFVVECRDRPFFALSASFAWCLGRRGCATRLPPDCERDRDLFLMGQLPEPGRREREFQRFEQDDSLTFFEGRLEHQDWFIKLLVERTWGPGAGAKIEYFKYKPDPEAILAHTVMLIRRAERRGQSSAK